jgi:hypothetical protein
MTPPSGAAPECRGDSIYPHRSVFVAVEVRTRSVTGGTDASGGPLAGLLRSADLSTSEVTDLKR